MKSNTVLLFLGTTNWPLLGVVEHSWYEIDSSTTQSLHATPFRFRANPAHIRQSGPDSGPGSQSNAPKTFQVGPSSLGSENPTPNPELVSQNVFIKSFSKCQIPHKFVNLLCMLVIMQDKLRDLCGN